MPRQWSWSALTGGVALVLGLTSSPVRSEIRFQAGIEIKVGSAPAAFELAKIEGQRLVVARDQGLALVGPLEGPLPVTIRLKELQFVKSLAIGPFTRPGALDIACISGSAIYLLRGDGDREFGQPTEIPLPERPKLVRSRVVAQGQLPRLFVVDEAGISVLSDAALGRQLQRIVPAEFVSDLEVSDLNGDGIADIVAAENHNDRILILDGNSAGAFENPRRVPSVGAPSHVLVGDANGDGRRDVLVGGQSGIVLHARNEQGAFLPPRTLTKQHHLGGIAGGDVNGDGRLDLAVTDSLRGIVTVFVNGGMGEFELQRSYTAGGGASSVILADVTEDGRVDLLTLNQGNDTVTLLRGRGDGSFDGSPTILGTTSELTSMVLADFDADSRLDIAATSEQTGVLSVFLGNGEGDFAGLPPLKVGGRPRGLVAGELNGDYLPDLAIADFGRDRVVILAGADAGSFGAPQQIPVGKGPIAVAIGDFQGKGAGDLAVINNVSDTVSILYNDGKGGFPRIEHFPVVKQPSFLVVGDVNRDQRSDLVVGNDQSKTVSVLKGNGEALAAPTTQTLTGNARVPAADDLDRDGFVDLIVVNDDANTVDVLPGRRDDRFGERLSISVGSEPSEVVTGDVNSDGLVDVVVLHHAPPTITILLNTSAAAADRLRTASLQRHE